MATPTPLPSSFVAAQVLTAAEMNDLRGAFRVLQVKEAQVETNQTFTSTSFIDLTNATVTITPSDINNKILLIGGVEAGVASATGFLMQFVRDITALFEPRTTSYTAGITLGTNLVFIDSPNTIAATTYKIQVRTTGSVSTTVNNSTFFALEVSE
jgi:hypothetical protein